VLLFKHSAGLITGFCSVQEIGQSILGHPFFMARVLVRGKNGSLRTNSGLNNYLEFEAELGCRE
jgi:hypothetical protein